MNIIFDLDGTLIDSRCRLYRLFQKLVPESNLSHDSYWSLKRRKISNETILIREFGYDEAAIVRFVADWMGLIESTEYLVLDTNIPGIHESLGRLRIDANLHVCTARQQRKAVVDQLDRLGLGRFFSNVMVTEQIRGKEEMIGALPDLSSTDWIIGDTGKDIQVGQALGIKTCAVLTGFLSEESLMPYSPDLILPSVADFRL